MKKETRRGFLKLLGKMGIVGAVCLKAPKLVFGGIKKEEEKENVKLFTDESSNMPETMVSVYDLHDNNFTGLNSFTDMVTKTLRQNSGRIAKNIEQNNSLWKQ